MIKLALLSLLVCAAFAAFSFDGGMKRSLSPRAQFSQHPYVALIVATTSDNTIEYVCTGSIIGKAPKGLVLTTAYCIQDRTDSTGKPVKYEVLVENPEGNTTLGSTKFTPFAVAERISHPEATKLSNFTFQSAFPNGTSIGFSVVVAPHDVGVVRLAGPITIPEARTVNLSKSIPPVGDQVAMVGYGGPDFFTLGATVNTIVLESREVPPAGSPVSNTKLVFLRDARSGVPANLSQAVEPGDEGAPMMHHSGQVAIAEGSWQVNPNTTDVITFATIGASVPANMEFIEKQMAQQPVRPSAAASLAPFAALLALAMAALL